MFDQKGRFVFQNFSQLKPFANFLPGIAGLEGIPMWVFYVNRGQGISSFGTASKDFAIMEFQPATKAYRLTPIYGFRTFIKKISADATELYEPFSDRSDEGSITRTMYIGIDEFEIEEIDEQAGFKVNVLYYSIPGEDFAALARQVTIQNISEERAPLEILDGMPVINPFGVDNPAQKDMSRTAEAWMEVYNLENELPYFKVRVSMGDTAQVEMVEAGNFAMAFSQFEVGSKFLKPIVDPQLIFGSQLSFNKPIEFLKVSLSSLSQQPQRTLGYTPAAFFGDTQELAPQEQFRLYSIYGKCSSQEQLEEIRASLTPEYYTRRLERSHEIMEEITSPIKTRTAKPIFDAYSQQTYLDNVLRGGKPICLPGGAVYHVYSRKHGDPERDYNYFYLAPEFYSQGNGNYRDVNQNRRSDVLFNPKVGDFNIKFFLSLIQLDGYNPLEIRGTKFVISSEGIEKVRSAIDLPGLAEFLSQPFTPGSLVHFLSDLDGRAQVSKEEIFNIVFPLTEQVIDAVHGIGFWMDHWTYNLDLVESYLAIFPERQDELFFGGREIPWYESYARVQPTAERYRLTPAGLRQYHSIDEDEDKQEEISSRGFGQTWVLASEKLYRSSVFEKLFILLALKAASLDQAGVGVEMESGKPGWYDALNGFPGLLGASIPETYEVARLSGMLISALEGVEAEIFLPVEFGGFLEGLIKIFSDHSDDPLKAWQHTSNLRADFREHVYAGISGKEQAYPASHVRSILNEIAAYITKAVARVEDLQPDLPPTYLYFDASFQGSSDEPIEVNELTFEKQVLPDFLEGPVHAMRVADKEQAGRIYQSVRRSGLFDEKLGMYKVNASLEGVSHEIGRTTAFPPGWLENESVWLHMEYKYLLEVLRAGLYEEYYQDLETALVPFQKLERYGRSLLENSSFIASSAYPDHSLHGTGFVARLSGSTAEYLSMWFEMFAGRTPFVVEEGELKFKLKPALAGWLFPEEGVVEFTFLGHTRVKYFNPKQQDTWKSEIISLELVDHQGEVQQIEGGVVPAPFSADVRDGKLQEIRAYIGEVL